MQYTFPLPPPMAISVMEFAAHLLVIGFLLAAALGIVPPSCQISMTSVRRRLLLSGAVLVIFGVNSVKANRGLFVAVEVWLSVFTAIRLVFRLSGWRFSLRSGCGALIVGCVVSWVVVISPAYKRWYDTLWERRPVCRHHLKNTVIAAQNWAAINENRLPNSVVEPAGDPPHSWRVAILAYDDRPDLPRLYRMDAEWDAAVNQPIAQARVWMFQCEANPFPADAAGRYYTNYAAVTGPNTAFPGGKGVTVEGISRSDGMAQTILFGECSGLNIVWTEPRDIDVSKQKIGINLPGDRPRYSSSILSSYHPGGAHVAFADGRVQFLSEKIDPKVLKAMTTVADIEETEEDEAK